MFLTLDSKLVALRVRVEVEVPREHERIRTRQARQVLDDQRSVDDHHRTDVEQARHVICPDAERTPVRSGGASLGAKSNEERLVEAPLRDLRQGASSNRLRHPHLVRRTTFYYPVIAVYAHKNAFALSFQDLLYGLRPSHRSRASLHDRALCCTTRDGIHYRPASTANDCHKAAGHPQTPTTHGTCPTMPAAGTPQTPMSTKNQPHPRTCHGLSGSSSPLFLSVLQFVSLGRFTPLTFGCFATANDPVASVMVVIGLVRGLAAPSCDRSLGSSPHFLVSATRVVSTVSTSYLSRGHASAIPEEVI